MKLQIRSTILAALVLSCIGCGEAQETTQLERPEAGVFITQGVVREIGGDFYEQAHSVSILANVAASPGPFLSYIRKCRMDMRSDESCEASLKEIERGLSVLTGDLPRGDLSKLTRQLEAALTAPVGEVIMSHAGEN